MRINQINKLKNRQKRKNNKEIIKNKPQISGITIKLFTMTPKKPNSALRKVAKVRINPQNPPKAGNNTVLAYIPGEKHTLTLHNRVLMIPLRTKDLPGVKYRILRGVLDAKPPVRNQSRSKYGCKSN